MKEPVVILTYDGDKTIKATRDNTTMYRFYGDLWVYDHIFVIVNNRTKHGLYVFRHQEGYETSVNFMLRNDYPAYINLRSVPECDRRAFDRTVHEEAADVDNGIPTDWR